MSEAIYRKYRPTAFSDVTNQDHVKQTIRNQITADTTAHAYLFTGPRGVGKTTIARIIARAVNCATPKEGEPCNECEFCKEILSDSCMDIYEIDAASHTDVANVRENIIENIRFAPNRLKYKVFIIDEVHMLSNHAFNALLKTMEEPPDHALFVLATTEIHKVPQTIISRCQRFDFKRIPVKDLVLRMQKIIADEGVKITDDVLQEIARHADGCARDAESLLGQVLALGEKEINMEAASLVLPATTIVLVVDLLEAILQKDVKKSIDLLNEYVGQGVDMPQLTNDVVDLLHNMLMVKLGGEEQFDISYSDDVRARLKPMIEQMNRDTIISFIEILLDTKKSIRSDSIPQLALEVAIVRMCPEGNTSLPQEPQTMPHESPTLPNEPQTIPHESPTLPQDPPTIPYESPTLPNEPQTIPHEPQTQPQEPSTPIQPVDTALGDIPVVKLTDVERNWPNVFQKVKQVNASLPLVIQTGKPASMNGNELEIHFQYQLHADQINQMRNKATLEGVLEEVLGHKVIVRGVYAHQEADDVVDGILDDFGGSVA